MPAPKNVTRFHYQDAIYLPPAQSLAMVLGVFNLIIKNSETKEETEKEEKKINNNVLPSHHPLLLLVPLFFTQAQDCAMQNLEKACARGNLTG